MTDGKTTCAALAYCDWLVISLHNDIFLEVVPRFFLHVKAGRSLSTGLHSAAGWEEKLDALEDRGVLPFHGSPTSFPFWGNKFGLQITASMKDTWVTLSRNCSQYTRRPPRGHRGYKLILVVLAMRPEEGFKFTPEEDAENEKRLADASPVHRRRIAVVQAKKKRAKKRAEKKRLAEAAATTGAGTGAGCGSCAPGAACVGADSASS
jgi:hypothetical protein